MDHNLILHPTTKMGRKGRIYEVFLGTQIIASGVSPEFAACRELKDRGFEGNAVFWRKGKATWDFTIPIKWGAGRTVSETDRHGLRFAKWAPHPMFGKPEEDELEDVA